MACVTANLLSLLKMNPVAHNCRLHGLPTILRLAPCRSNVVGVLTGIYNGEGPPEFHVCEIKMVNSSPEWMSADVHPQESLGSYMNQMLNVMA